MLIYTLVAGVFSASADRFCSRSVLHILNAFFVIIAALKAGEGETYRYPLTIRLVN